MARRNPSSGLPRDKENKTMVVKHVKQVGANGADVSLPTELKLSCLHSFSCQRRGAHSGAHAERASSTSARRWRGCSSHCTRAGLFFAKKPLNRVNTPIRARKDGQEGRECARLAEEGRGCRGPFRTTAAFFQRKLQLTYILDHYPEIDGSYTGETSLIRVCCA